MATVENLHKGLPEFYEITSALNKLVASELLDAGDTTFSSWHSNMRRSIDVSPLIAEQTDLGSDRLRLQVVGDAYMGVALIFSSRNLFDRRHYGFFIQPKSDNSISVTHGPTIKSKRESYIGSSILDPAQEVRASEEITRALTNDLFMAAITKQNAR